MISRLQLASEKQGTSPSIYLLAGTSRCACSYGRVIAKIVCATARHLSAIRGVLVPWSLVALGQVQFDSDYSVEDDASPIFSQKVRDSILFALEKGYC